MYEYIASLQEIPMTSTLTYFHLILVPSTIRFCALVVAGQADQEDGDAPTRRRLKKFPPPFPPYFKIVLPLSITCAVVGSDYLDLAF